MTRLEKYALIDPIIEGWARSHSLKILDSFAGREERFCYISRPNGEVFQIAIQPPIEGMVTVDAGSVETLDDRELSQNWVVPTSDLRTVLDGAVQEVLAWLDAGERVK